jgi:hypothetical protein
VAAIELKFGLLWIWSFDESIACPVIPYQKKAKYRKQRRTDKIHHIKDP